MFLKKGYPDVVYFVKHSEENDELKYSLRSLKNLNHGRVFIAGYKPSWVSEAIEHIPVKQSGKKYENVRNNWLAALNDPRLSEDFIIMNDDFFIMQPTKQIPVLRRMENIEHYIELYTKLNPASHYVATMKKARDVLNSWGITEISSYELHVPMLINKKKMQEIFEKAPNGGHLRTLYGNYYNLQGERIHDVKVIRDDQDISNDQQFLSTIDESFQSGLIGKYLRRKFAKVLVFSHANDPDGLLSVILAQLAFAKVDYLLTNNPQKDITAYLDEHQAELKDYDFIIISDIYPGRPVLERLPKAYWFDHKQSSIDKIKKHNLKLPNAVVETDIDGRPTSGSELFYRWLKDLKLISDESSGFVEYIRQLDTWDFK